MSFKDIVNREELEFEDREDLIKYIKKHYQYMINKKPFFQIISISGMGGMGKSRLAKQLDPILKNEYKSISDQSVFYITLEISGHDHFLTALVEIRSRINEPCPLFDYALLTYWKRTQITILNDSFLKNFSKQWKNLSDFLGEIASISNTNYSLDSILAIVEKIFYIIREKYYTSLFNKHSKKISEYSDNELKDCLAGFLGMDINRLFHDKNLCIIIDSFNQYPSPDTSNWLTDLMEQANTGLFIIFGREAITYPGEIKKYVKKKSIKVLPNANACKLLKSNIPNADSSLINHLLKITECIPIYLDLAIRTYKNPFLKEKIYDENLIFMYKNKTDFTYAFFSHLKSSHQNFLLVLSFLQLFDLEIYSYIITICPDASITEYQDINSLSIISNVESSCGFFKVHDVLNTNVILVLDKSIRKYLFEKYLNHIVSKTILYASDSQKIILYKHILKMIVKNKFILNTKNTELVLDLFFSLKQTVRTLLPTELDIVNTYKPLDEINYLTRAVMLERENTLARLNYLKNINFKNNSLGKHNKSLNIIYGFLKMWCGNDKPLVQYLSSSYPLLDDTEIREWYYAQTVIFWADHLTITGKFVTAEKVLCGFKQKLQNYPEQDNSIFQVKRHTGHLFRFNMFMEKANVEYFSTTNTDGSFNNSYQEIYILTNLCETNCYFNPSNVYNYCYKGLKLGKNIKDLKSQAKIYYSMGIAFLHNKKYKRARKYIRKSMYLDTLDGYQLGVISSLLAFIYLQYSLRKKINSKSLELLLSKVSVYGFQYLPLAIINQNSVKIEEIHSQYEWLNFEKTVHNFRNFFLLIQH